MAGSRSARTARRLGFTPMAVITLLSGVLTGMLSAPGTSLAANRPVIALFSGGASVKTSNGLTWTMSVSSGGSLPTGKTLNVSIVHSDKRGTTSEQHAWQFRVKAATLQFNSKSGTATLNAGSQTKPVAAVDLAFKATSKSKIACDTGSGTIYDGTLKGKVFLVTGLVGGGTIGSKAMSFRLGLSTLLVESNCMQRGSVNDCARFSTFSSGNVPGWQAQASGFSETVPGYSIQSVFVSRQTNLSSPTGATRVDTGEQDAIHERYNTTTKVFSVTTGTTGFVTGSATLSGGHIQTSTSRCTLAGKRHIETTIFDGSARYKSPAGKAISVKTSLSGTLTAPASTTRGLYSVTTFGAR